MGAQENVNEQPRKGEATPAPAEPLLSLVHDNFPVGELRGWKKVAQVLPYPILGFLVALFRTPLLFKDANRNDLALSGS